MSHTTPTPSAPTPEEIATAWVVATDAAVTAMQPADRERGWAALDAHAAAMLFRGEYTAVALHQAITVALAWANHMLSASELANARVLAYRLRAVLDAEAQHLTPARLQPAAADAASTGPDVLDQVRTLVDGLLSDREPDGHGRTADPDADDTAPRGGIQ